MSTKPKKPSLESIKRDYPYQYFGAHVNQQQTCFRLYAPNATSVSLMREENGWNHQAEIMKQNKDGVWEITVAQDLTWKEYKYYIENHNDYLSKPYQMARIDPFSEGFFGFVLTVSPPE